MSLNRKGILRLVILCLVLGCLAAYGGPANTTIDPASLSGRLVFVSQKLSRETPYPPDHRAYVLGLGERGNVPQPLTPAPDQKNAGIWSVWYLARNNATGEFYCYAIAEKSAGWFELHSLDATTTEFHPPAAFDAHAYAQTFAISHDGRYIAGILKGAQNEITITDLTGKTPPVQVIGQRAVPFDAPVWSPDDSRLAFVGALDGDINYAELFIAGRDGSHVRQLTDLPHWISWWVRVFMWGPRPKRWDNHQSRDPQWSPDGQWILFTDTDGIYRVHPDGSGLELIIRGAKSPAWSPDGRMITFVVYNDGAPLGSAYGLDAGVRPPNIYVSYPDGSGAVRVTDNRMPYIYTELNWVK